MEEDMPEEENKVPKDEEPKIFSIYIDENNKKKFNRRDFIRTATVLGTTITLTGCNLLPFPSDEESPEAEDRSSEKTPTKTSTAEMREEPTQKPTNTPTKAPTRTPTETEEPLPSGVVSESHSLFEGPHPSHPVITSTVVGEQVTILGKTSDGVWFNIIDSEGNVGWCYAEFIIVIDNTAIPTASNIPTPVSTEEPNPIGEVTYSHSLIKGPDTSHPFITNTVVGEEVTILGKTSDGVWFKVVDLKGNIGWCFAEFITVITNITIPVIQNIPTPVATTCTCDNYEPCECDSYSPCSCDSYSSGCSCDEVCTCDTVHYWYPN
jgi:uncharacterized protein YraI